MKDNERIEKLKHNWLGWGGLDKEDQEIFEKTPFQEIVYLTYDGKQFRCKCQISKNPTTIYQIHEDYNPVPDKPHFPGFVLCEVVGGVYLAEPADPDTCPITAFPIPLHKAIDNGCVGYVPKEKIRDEWELFTTWPVWVDGEGSWTYDVSKDDIADGFYPAELGWVMFKEKNK